jgi:lysyl-tRNA synthetase class 2
MDADRSSVITEAVPAAPLVRSVPTRVLSERERSSIEERKEKAARWREAGLDPFPHAFPDRVDVAAVERLHDPQALDVGAHPQWRYRVAGRLVGRRHHGKSAFLDVRDHTGVMQVYVSSETLGADRYELLLELDIGDHVGVDGHLYVTRRRQLSICAEQWAVIAKSLRNPPDLHHGLDDLELRLRRRELDLMANAHARELFVARARAVAALRSWFDARGFVEIESPILQGSEGGANARSFDTHHNALGRDLSLRITCELYLKRCLIGGLDRVYEIGRCFRNEGLSPRHNPEFTICEWEEAYANHLTLADTIEHLIPHVAQQALGTTKIERGGRTIDLAPPWRRTTLREATLAATGVDVECATTAELLALLGEDGEDLERADLISAIYTKHVEGTLIQPTLVFDFPAELLPLVKRRPDAPQYAEAFDAVIDGLEVGTGVTEQNDPEEQRARLVEQRRQQGEADATEPQPHDEEYVQAVEYGMPLTGGGGMGVDRLVMLLTGRDSLREVILYPTMRPDGQPA